MIKDTFCILLNLSLVIAFTIAGKGNCNKEAEYFKYAAMGVVPKMGLNKTQAAGIIDLRVACMKQFQLDPKRMYNFEIGVDRRPFEELADVIACTNNGVDLYYDNGELNMVSFKALMKPEIRDDLLACLKAQTPSGYAKIMDFYLCFVPIIMDKKPV